MRNAGSSTAWRGRSLSKAKPPAGAPISVPAGDLDPVARRAAVGPRVRAAARQAGEKQRLAHRLVVLGLVADDQLEERPVAGSDALEHVERPLAHGRDVLEDLAAAEEGNVAAHGARGLEGVIEVGEVAAQQRLAAMAMHDPEILVGGDVAEVPVQRAHQRVLDALEVVVVEARDERERPIAGVLQGRSEG